jgi:uncharacterized protein (DUF924 family)
MSETARRTTHGRPQGILDFWFGGGEAAHKRWFTKDPVFDAEIRSKFMADYERARDGDYDDWQDEADSCLALVIILDQFPRNMFRNDPRAFATDAKALNIAQHAVAQGLDRQMTLLQRQFLYLPFQHSEDKHVQERSLELYRTLPDWDQPGSAFTFARSPRDGGRR